MRWHRQQTLFEKTGGDLDEFLKKREEQLLEDPAFMAKVAEKLRAQSSSQSQPGRSAPIVNLPPSLSRVASAAPAVSAGDDDMGDEALFRFATSR